VSADYAISLPFSFNASGGLGVTSDNKKIWQDRVVLVVMSYLNERVMRPDYGTHVRDFAFETVDDATFFIKNEVQAGFSKWLPNLFLDDVTAVIDPVDNILNITITYSYGPNQADSVIIRTASLTSTGTIILEA
jgi:phage baseplate assembly protein W